MHLKKSYIYQFIAILLLIISMQCFNGNWYEWKTDEGRITSYYEENPFFISELSKDGIENLVGLYASGYVSTEEVEPIKKLAMVLRSSTAVIVADCFVILAIF